MHAKTTPKPSKGPSKENVAVHGLYPNVFPTRSRIDALNKVGFRKAPILASSPVSVQSLPARSTPVTEHAAEAKVEDWLGATARITGCVLGLGSMAFIAPMLVAAPVAVAVGIGAQVIFHPLGFAAAGPDRKVEPQGFFPDNDLKSREYHDKLGQVHYHTHTYMRDHSAQQDHSAA